MQVQAVGDPQRGRESLKSPRIGGIRTGAHHVQVGGRSSGREQTQGVLQSLVGCDTPKTEPTPHLGPPLHVRHHDAVGDDPTLQARRGQRLHVGMGGEPHSIRPAEAPPGDRAEPDLLEGPLPPGVQEAPMGRDADSGAGGTHGQHLIGEAVDAVHVDHLGPRQALAQARRQRIATRAQPAQVAHGHAPVRLPRAGTIRRSPGREHRDLMTRGLLRRRQPTDHSLHAADAGGRHPADVHDAHQRPRMPAGSS